LSGFRANCLETRAAVDKHEQSLMYSHKQQHYSSITHCLRSFVQFTHYQVQSNLPIIIIIIIIINATKNSSFKD